MTAEQHQRLYEQEIMSPVQGLVAGLVAGVVMMLVSTAGFALQGKGLWTPINAIGDFLRAHPDPSPAFAGTTSLIGLGIHLLVGALLGALYASAQERIDARSLVFIALYYGLVIWIVATFLITSWLRPWFHDLWRSWPVLVGHLAFGLTLAVAAVLRLRGSGTTEPGPN